MRGIHPVDFSRSNVTLVVVRFSIIGIVAFCLAYLFGVRLTGSLSSCRRARLPKAVWSRCNDYPMGAGVEAHDVRDHGHSFHLAHARLKKFKLFSLFPNFCLSYSLILRNGRQYVYVEYIYTVPSERERS